MGGYRPGLRRDAQPTVPGAGVRKRRSLAGCGHDTELWVLSGMTAWPLCPALMGGERRAAEIPVRDTVTTSLLDFLLDLMMWPIVLCVTNYSRWVSVKSSFAPCPSICRHSLASTSCGYRRTPWPPTAAPTSSTLTTTPPCAATTVSGMLGCIT